MFRKRSSLFCKRASKQFLAASWQAKSFSTVDHVNRFISFPIGPSFERNSQIARKRCNAYSRLISVCLRGILQEHLFNEIIALFAHKL